MSASSNRRNILTLIIIAVLLLAIPFGLKLLRDQQILRSKAGGAPISFQGHNVSVLGDKQVFRLDDQGTPTVGLTLTSPFGPAASGNSGPIASVPFVIPSIPSSFPIPSSLPTNQPSIVATATCPASQRNLPSGYAINLVTNDLAIQASDFYLLLGGVKYSASDAGVQLTANRSDAMTGLPSVNFTVTWPNTSARLLGEINSHGTTWGWDYVVTPITGAPNARGVGYGPSNVSGNNCQAFSNPGDLVINVPDSDPTTLGIHFTNLRMQPFW